MKHPVFPSYYCLHKTFFLKNNTLLVYYWFIQFVNNLNLQKEFSSDIHNFVHCGKKKKLIIINGLLHLIIILLLYNSKLTRKLLFWLTTSVNTFYYLFLNYSIHVSSLCFQSSRLLHPGYG